MKRYWLLLFALTTPTLFAAAQQAYGSPLAIDLDGRNFDAAFTDVQHGVVFDFVHVGEPVETAWTEPDRNIGFLVLNRHGDKALSKDGRANLQLWSEILAGWRKQIASGAAPIDVPVTFHVGSSWEMFGNLTHQPLSKEEGEQSKAMADKGEPWQSNGFRALAFFDRKENGGNGNGMIDEGDFVYTHLRVWVDTAHNGRSEDGKMYSKKELGIKYIGLNYSASDRVDRYGNRLRYASKVGMVDGKTLDVDDVYFRMVRNSPAPN